MNLHNKKTDNKTIALYGFGGIDLAGSGVNHFMAKPVNFFDIRQRKLKSNDPILVFDNNTIWSIINLL